MPAPKVSRTSWKAIKAQCAIDAGCRPADVDAFLAAHAVIFNNHLKYYGKIFINSFGTFTTKGIRNRETTHWTTGQRVMTNGKIVAHLKLHPDVIKRLKESGF